MSLHLLKTAFSRRKFIQNVGKTTAVVWASGLFSRTLHAAGVRGENKTTVSGVVFLDENMTGEATGQKPLAGILISNGEDIVKTDEKGRYQIEVTDNTIIHLIKPAGYQVRLDENNLPEFYYIHKPEGSPDYGDNYKGVEPTGPLPPSIDFPLYRQEESEEFKVIFTADPQSYVLQHLNWYSADTTERFQNDKPAFAIALGDIVGDNLDLYEPYNAINGKTGFPWYNIVGNHDLNFFSPNDKYSTETFQKYFGPTDYAFQYAKVHFIVLNNVYWRGFSRLRRDGWPVRGRYYGHLRKRQLEYVKNLVEHIPLDHRIVVCTHIPLISLDPTAAKRNTPEFAELLSILSRHDYTMSFSGHRHINRNSFHGADSGYQSPGGSEHHHCNLVATCGSWYRGTLDEQGIPISTCRDGSPKGYALGIFSGNQYKIENKHLGRDDNQHMLVYFSEVVESNQIREAPVVVNVFNGSEKTQVKMQIDDGEWITMDQFIGEDPFYLKHRENTRNFTEAGEGVLNAPVRTDHLWKAELPASLDVGWHQLKIAVRDTFGDVYREERSFVVTSPGRPEIEPLNNGTRGQRRQV